MATPQPHHTQPADPVTVEQAQAAVDQFEVAIDPKPTVVGIPGSEPAAPCDVAISVHPRPEKADHEQPLSSEVPAPAQQQQQQQQQQHQQQQQQQQAQQAQQAQAQQQLAAQQRQAQLASQQAQQQQQQQQAHVQQQQQLAAQQQQQLLAQQRQQQQLMQRQGTALTPQQLAAQQLARQQRGANAVAGGAQIASVSDDARKVLAGYLHCTHRGTNPDGTEGRCQCGGFVYTPGTQSQGDCEKCSHSVNAHGDLSTLRTDALSSCAVTAQNLHNCYLKLNRAAPGAPPPAAAAASAAGPASAAAAAAAATTAVAVTTPRTASSVEELNRQIQDYKQQLQQMTIAGRMKPEEVQQANVQEIRRREERYLVYLGKPPFENPPIRLAMSNFKNLNFVGKVSDEDLSRLEQVIGYFLTGINMLDLLEPKAYASEVGPVETYQRNYLRWQLYCRGRSGHTIKGLRLPAVDIFGLEFLKAIFSQVHKTFFERFQFDEPTTAIAHKFLEGVRGQIAADKAPIFLSDTSGKISALASTAANEVQSASAGGNRKRKADGGAATASLDPQQAAHAKALARSMAAMPKKRWSKLDVASASAEGGTEVVVRTSGLLSGPIGGGAQYRCIFSCPSYRVDSNFVVPVEGGTHFTITTPKWPYATTTTRVVVQESTGEIVPFDGTSVAERFTFKAADTAVARGANGKASAGGTKRKVSAASEQSTALESREDAGIKEEQDGLVVYKVRYNELAPPAVPASIIHPQKSPDDWSLLIQAKCIFQTQLPKMPKDYIARLVLNRQHRNLCLIKNGKVIGGLCYRPFPTLGFVEIVFCAIDQSEQVKGYGTRLMNNFKEVVRKEGYHYFLTYADNFAVGYFGKQGFTKTISLPRERWVGYIKDYEGGTLMECVIDAKICYTALPQMLRRQRSVIATAMRDISTSHVVHKGIDVKGIKEPKDYEKGLEKVKLKRSPALDNAEALAKASRAGFEDAMANPDVARPYFYPLNKIKGLVEAGWRPPVRHLKLRGEIVTGAPFEVLLQKELARILVQIRQHEDAWPYKEPVDINVVPDYYKIIKNPIDLATIAQRLDAGTYYRTKRLFVADLVRMCDNCREFNKDNWEYYNTANHLQEYFMDLLKDIEVIEEQPALVGGGAEGQLPTKAAKTEAGQSAAAVAQQRLAAQHMQQQQAARRQQAAAQQQQQQQQQELAARQAASQAASQPRPTGGKQTGQAAQQQLQQQQQVLQQQQQQQQPPQ